MSPFEKMFDTPKTSPDLMAELSEAASGELHNSNLYDENEDPNGDLVDPATGKRIDNTTMLYDDENLIQEASALKATDDATGDAADQWLRDNDPDYKG